MVLLQSEALHGIYLVNFLEMINSLLKSNGLLVEKALVNIENALVDIDNALVPIQVLNLI